MALRAAMPPRALKAVTAVGSSVWISVMPPVCTTLVAVEGRAVQAAVAAVLPELL